MSTPTIAIKPELAELIHAKVASGLYHSPEDVILEGLRLISEQDEIRRMRLENLRKEIQKGLDSSERGDVLTFSSGAEIAAHIAVEGRKILADRKLLK